MYQIQFYVPHSHLETVKAALFAAGAGQVGNYSHCCWQTKGEGQFLPSESSLPYTGSKYQINTIDEYKVEMVCQAHVLKQAIQALCSHHPYETPAYSIIKIDTPND